MIKTIILDFDGVVAESVDIKTEAFRELFKEYKDLIDDIGKYHLQNNAISRFIKFKYIYENFLGEEYTEEVEKELGKRFWEIVFRKVVECPFVVGAEDFLKKFSKTRPIYLVSATPQEELARILTRRNNFLSSSIADIQELLRELEVNISQKSQSNAVKR